MDAATWRTMLERTLDDGRLSRAEAQALGAWLTDAREAATPAGEADARRRLRAEVFRLARERAAQEGAEGLLAWAEAVVARLDAVRAGPAPPPSRSEAWFGPGPDCLRALLATWRGVRGQADVCVFTVTDDRITSAMLEAMRRGVRIRLITDDAKREDLGSDVERLRVAGAQVAVDGGPAHMHHKFAVFDGRLLLNGSFNWTRSASEANAENLVATDEPGLVRAFAGAFERLWRKLGDVGPGDSR